MGTTEKKKSTPTPCATFLATLIEKLKTNAYWQIIGLVEEPKGNKQECEYFGEEYVDQRGPGISGDDYSGYLYIPLEGQWLKIWYS